MTTVVLNPLRHPLMLSLIVILFNKLCTTEKIIKGNNIGVQFTVHDFNDTFEDVKKKMKIVSGQFSRVSTFGIMARNDNSTYLFGSTYNKSFPQVYSAEAAGIVNQKDKTSLKIIIGIHPHTDEKYFKKEVELAQESALWSQKSKSDTVTGFVLDFTEQPLDIAKIKTAYATITLSPQLKDLPFGLRLSCDTILQEFNSISEIINNKENGIIFLDCVEHSNINLPGKEAFEKVAEKFQNISAILKENNLSVLRTGQTGYPARENVEQDISELQHFWKAADDWATKNDFQILMTEAFDNPSKKWYNTTKHEGNYGWWTSSKHTNDTGEYIVFKEKASGITTVVQSKTLFKPANGAVGGKSIDTSLRYTVALIGMIIMRFVV